MQTRFFISILISLAITGCHSTKRISSGHNNKQETVWLSVEANPNDESLNEIICNYRCVYDEPHTFDENYWKNIDIRFSLQPVSGQTYELPNGGIKISGTFASVWVWDKSYDNQNIVGTIKVVKYKENKQLTLDLNLSEVSNLKGELNNKELINGIYTFKCK